MSKDDKKRSPDFTANKTREEVLTKNLRIRIDPSFISTVMPDVQANTRIVGVCGIPKASIHNRASTTVDDWFFSDFYLLNYMLKGLCREESWYTTVGPLALLVRYENESLLYPHGNHGTASKIVLSKEIIEGDEITKPKVVSSDNLYTEVTRSLIEEDRLAYVNDQTLFILVFGHGHFSTRGIKLGKESKVRQWRIVALDIKNMIGENSNVTILTTACFFWGLVNQPRHQMDYIKYCEPVA